MNRTQDEIVKRIEDRKEHADFFGAEIGDYLDFLDFEHAKPYLKETATKEAWAEAKRPYTDPVHEIKEYMSFAWEKALGERGLSAMRSLCHMKAWLWLDGQDEFLEELQIDNYHNYGQEKLIAICEKYNIDWKQYKNE